MRAINTSILTADTLKSETEKLWVYNGLDCCVTAEVLDVIKPQLGNNARATYEFSKSLMAPIFEMNMRGVLVDIQARDEAIAAYLKDLNHLEHNLNAILVEGLGIEMNWNSPAQLKKLFYDILKLPLIRKRNSKGLLAPTVNRDALEKLEFHFDAQIIVAHILALRDIKKKIGVLKTSIDEDQRIRTSYNIAGTTTGRLSSSLSDFGTGGNLQNIEERLRRIFVADPGMKFAYIDLEQAESRLVGAICWNRFGFSNYLDACEGGDLHTSVTKMTKPGLPWTGDLKQDKEVAETPYYRQHSHRHMSKVLGHGSNYQGQPHTMEKHTKIPSKIIKEFQGSYFAAFPEILRWHAWVAQTIKDEGKLISLMGRERTFFGRRNDPTTVREAVAFDPQSSVADILNQAMLKIWRANICQILLQVHDALLIQYPEEKEDEIVPQVIELMKIPVELNNNRTLLIPADAQIGWNWGKMSKDKQTGAVINPNGLSKFRGHDDRQRQAAPHFMDRQFL